MHTAPFTYTRPKTLGEAEQLYEGSDDASYLAGGMTLIPTMKQRLAAPSTLIDLNAIPELCGIRREGARLCIGALARHAEVAHSQSIRQAIPALAIQARSIGDPAVRNRGTIGGSLVNNDPSADYPSGALALDAIIRTTRRQIAADFFFVDMFNTALEEGEILVDVVLRIPRRAGYAKVVNPASRYAMAGVFIADFGDEVRVAVTGAGPCVFRLTELENELSKSFSTAALDSVNISPDGLNADIHGSAAYRAQLVKTVAQRAIAFALNNRSDEER